MKRIHFVELEDLPWMPAAVRNGGRDALDVMFARGKFYGALVPRLAAWLDATGEKRLVDLCSGSGGGALTMLQALRAAGRADVHLTLTDLYPDADLRTRAAALHDPALDALPQSVDALHVAHDVRGLRTMFSALHHFQPAQVQQMLADAVAARAPVAFFDVAAAPAIRKAPIVVLPLLIPINATVLFLLSWLLMPLVRPVRLSRLLLTYIVPVIPLLFAWDGTVSALRAYTPDELLALARSVPGADGYVWEAGTGGNALYLLGRKA